MAGITSSIDSLPTPSLLLDRPRLARNVTRMRERAAALGVTLRPHLKTAKSVDAARFVLDGAPGPATVLTLTEAEMFGSLQRAFKDIGDANPFTVERVLGRA